MANGTITFPRPGMTLSMTDKMKNVIFNLYKYNKRNSKQTGNSHNDQRLPNIWHTTITAKIRQVRPSRRNTSNSD